MKKTALIQWNAGLFLLRILFQNFDVYAQENLRVFKLDAYESFSKADWKDSVYLLPQFQTGTLEYNNGFQVEGSWLMNYNRYFESMDMISDTGDTLSVKRTPELKFVNLQGRLFIHNYNLGFIEVLTKAPVALGVKYIMGTAGLQSNFDRRGYTDIYDRYYVKAPLYFFIGHNNNLYKANQTSILRFYPEHDVEIREYIKAERINFYVEGDLKRLLAFCNRFDFKFEKSASPEYFRIPANERITTVPWKNEIYAYPEFQSAHVTMRDRTSSTFNHKVNYNHFSGLIEYIDKNNDTLAIKPSANIRLVNIDGDVYCVTSTKGYVKLLLQGKVSLGIKKRITLVRKELLEEDSISESISEQSNPTYIDNPKEIAKYDRLYAKTASYFFINSLYNGFFANYETVFLAFPGHKKEVAVYLNENKPDFKNESDLIKLVRFCNQLSRH